MTALPTCEAYIPEAISSGPTTREATRRRGRAFRAQLAKDGAIRSRSASWCQTLLNASVVHEVTSTGSVHSSGIKRCGNVGLCPTCAPIVREQRATEIDAAAALVRALGGTVIFVTVTMPHRNRDKLDWLLPVVQKSWRQVWSGRDAQNFKDGFSMLGSVRAIEITDMDLDDPITTGSGWHPHIHALLFFDRKVSVDTVRHFITPRWTENVRKLTKGRRVPSSRYGVDVRKVRDSKGMAGYLSKVDGGWGAGLEITRSDIKHTRGRHSIPELLDHAATGETKYVKRWIELEHALHGRRIIQWSPGLRDKLHNLAVPFIGAEHDPRRILAENWVDSALEAPDEALAARDAVDPVVYRVETPGEVWMLAVRQGREHEIREAVLLEARMLGLIREPGPPD